MTIIIAWLALLPFYPSIDHTLHEPYLSSPAAFLYPLNLLSRIIIAWDWAKRISKDNAIFSRHSKVVGIRFAPRDWTVAKARFTRCTTYTIHTYMYQLTVS